MNRIRSAAVDEYLRDLQRALKDLPARQRNEIMAEIEEHIDNRLEESPETTDSQVRNVLERVGDPAEIAADARERFGIRPVKHRWTDTAAIVLLLIGGFFIIGWFVGVVLLWLSDAWNTRDKLLGTFVVPGGLAAALGIGVFAAGSGSCPVPEPGVTAVCTPDPGGLSALLPSILWALIVIAPIVMAVYLGRRLRRARFAGAA